MNPLIRQLRAHSLALLAVLGVTGCVVTGPDGGGRRTNPGTCASGRDANAVNSGANLQVITPTCFFTIRARAERLSYQSTVTLPVGSTGPNTPLVTIEVLSSYDLSTIVPQTTTFMATDPSNSQQKRADVTATGQPGYHTALGDTTAMRDSIAAVIDGLSSSYNPRFAKAFFVSVGNVALGSHDLIGPSNPLPGQAYAYRMRTEWDTVGYTYSWAVDGSPISATGAQMLHSFSTLDGHVIRSISTATSGTSDTLFSSVYVPFLASISGPSSHDVNGSGSWSTVIPAGTAPYAYAWYVDDQPTGVTSATFVGGVSAAMGSHILRVDVTDSAGHSASGSMVVNVSGSGCDPTMISCND